MSCLSQVYPAVRPFATGYRRFADALTSPPAWPFSIKLFRKSIFIYLICKTIVLLPIASMVWGPDAYVVLPPERPGVLSYFQGLLTISGVARYYLAFVFGVLFFAGVGLLGIWSRACTIGVYFCIVNLNTRAWPILNGGDNITEVMLVYLMLMSASPKPSLSPWAQIDNALTNVSFFLARFQLVTVYVVSGLAKVAGVQWQQGVALYYILSVDEYSGPLAKLFLSSDLLIVGGTYFTILFQISFPFLVWFRQTRWLMLGCGVLLHGMIAMLMGLWDFSLAILACYTLFLPPSLERAFGELKLRQVERLAPNRALQPAGSGSS